MGDQANDLRDQRDLMADKLSKIANITVVETEAGYNVSLGGQPLVEGGEVTATVDSAFLNNAYAAGTLKGGEAYGMIFSKNTYVTDYKKQLNDMASTIATGDVEITIPAGSNLPEGTVLTNDAKITQADGTVVTLAAGQAMPKGATMYEDAKTIVKGLNGLHKLGYAMDGSAGRDFFVTSGDAGTIKLNPEIAADVSLFATSLRTTVDADGNTQVVKGNNTLALLLTNLKDSKFTTPDGKVSNTVGGLLGSMVGQLGIQSQEAARQTDNSDYLVEQVNSRRQSVSGVSLDEEMSNMLVFQHAYSAAARFMTTFDELLDKLINSTGTVGR
ncbi:flagellar hook-associated protein FlgK [compost metagenome]